MVCVCVSVGMSVSTLLRVCQDMFVSKATWVLCLFESTSVGKLSVHW